jgi:hypothetical protein
MGCAGNGLGMAWLGWTWAGHCLCLTWDLEVVGWAGNGLDLAWAGLVMG